MSHGPGMGLWPRFVSVMWYIHLAKISDLGQARGACQYSHVGANIHPARGRANRKHLYNICTASAQRL